MDPKDLMVFFVVILIFGGTMVVLKPLAAALAERIRHRPEIAPDASHELVDEVRAMRQELAELAERVDFTERLLAKGGEAARFEPRGS
ncbi:MAG TPA: hypothetical protein VNG35_05780 [Gemmatimonadales bacterium]|nr:hypothetical protein [Gemmatimonadales bacterium]